MLESTFKLVFHWLWSLSDILYTLYSFYTPVFRRDVLWYGDVRPSVRPTLRPTLRPGLRLPVFRTFLMHALTY